VLQRLGVHDVSGRVKGDELDELTIRDRRMPIDVVAHGNLSDNRTIDRAKSDGCDSIGGDPLASPNAPFQDLEIVVNSPVHRGESENRTTRRREVVSAVYRAEART
jgi:hypothetical protein